MESAGAVVSATTGAAVSAGALLDETSAELDSGATELEDATTEELLATLELEGATLLLETAAELDETTVSLDWAASASASNSAKRSRGCAKDCTARRPAKHATK